MLFSVPSLNCKLDAPGETEPAGMFEHVIRMSEVDEVVACSKAVTISADSLDISKPI